MLRLIFLGNARNSSPSTRHYYSFPLRWYGDSVSIGSILRPFWEFVKEIWYMCGEEPQVCLYRKGHYSDDQGFVVRRIIIEKLKDKFLFT